MNRYNNKGCLSDILGLVSEPSSTVVIADFSQELPFAGQSKV